MIDRGIPRTGYAIYPVCSSADSKSIGHITSGTQSPTLKKNVGLALLPTDCAIVGREVDVEIRRKRVKAKIVKTQAIRYQWPAFFVYSSLIQGNEALFFLLCDNFYS